MTGSECTGGHWEKGLASVDKMTQVTLTGFVCLLCQLDRYHRLMVAYSKTSISQELFICFLINDTFFVKKLHHRHTGLRLTQVCRSFRLRQT